MKQILSVFLACLIFVACSKESEFEAMGVFESDELLISSEVAGKIIEFQASEGEIFKKDEIIARIDTTRQELDKERLKAQILSLKASLQDSSTQLASLLEQIALAKDEFDRSSKLYKQSATTKQSLDKTSSNLAFLQKDYTAKLEAMKLHNENINAQIKALELSIALLDDEIARASIKAPINATLLEKYAFEGELASPNKPLFKLADMSKIYLKAYFIDTSINSLKLGDKLKVLVDFNQDYKEYEGVITHIASKAEFTPKSIMLKDERKNLVYAVKIAVQNDGFLRLGSYGEVRLK